MEDRILIQFGKSTSENDIEDLKVLLTDIQNKFKFRWSIDTRKPLEVNQNAKKSI